jgi:hypothetical protein
MQTLVLCEQAKEDRLDQVMPAWTRDLDAILKPAQAWPVFKRVVLEELMNYVPRPDDGFDPVDEETKRRVLAVCWVPENEGPEHEEENTKKAAERENGMQIGSIEEDEGAFKMTGNDENMCSMDVWRKPTYVEKV